MRIYFEEEAHKYFNEQGQSYIPVSTVAKKLEKKKDWELIKKKYAKKHGITVREVQKDWDNKKELGIKAGTILHKDFEQETLNSKGLIKSCIYEHGVKWSLDIHNLEDNTTYPELIIYDHNYLICGQTDKAIIKDGVISVLDYKTDKSIDRKAFSSDWIKAEKLLPPVSFLDNCNYNMYSLKMSMYMYMLWNANKHYKVGDLILEHVEIERDDNGIPIFINDKPIIKSRKNIEVPYRKEAVRMIFDYYKQGKL